MKTHSLTHRHARSPCRYATRMLHSRRPPRPTFLAACRAISAYIRLQSRLLDAPDRIAFLRNATFPAHYAHLLRTIYHLSLPELPPPPRKRRITKNKKR